MGVLMSKKRRRRRDGAQPSGVGWEVAHVFFGVGTVPLSEGLIEKLVSRGWSRGDLEKFKTLGAVYSLQRNSIVFPAGVMA